VTRLVTVFSVFTLPLRQCPANSGRQRARSTKERFTRRRGGAGIALRCGGPGDTTKTVGQPARFARLISFLDLSEDQPSMLRFPQHLRASASPREIFLESTALSLLCRNVPETARGDADFRK
jgi:hypothetical protein